MCLTCNLNQLVVQFPSLKDRIDPAPCSFHFIATHEQRLIASNNVHDQTFISIGITFAERFRKAHIQWNVTQAHTARAWIFDHQPLLHTFIRLQADNQLVGYNLSGILTEDRMRDWFERDHNFRHASCKTLARAQVEWNASPTPVVDFALSATKVSVLLVSLPRSSR